MIDEFRGDYEFLSNFYPSEVVSGGITYPTVEHFFQAMKTKDPVHRKTIASQPTPSKAKYQGRSVQLRDDWESIKIAVMRGGLWIKFRDPWTDLSTKLLDTGDNFLVEGNNWGDQFWGKSGGEGQNWLGHLLMARRAELRAI